MIRAAALCRIDYAEAVSSDPVWLWRERMILDAVELEALVSFTAGKQLQQVATTVWPAGDQKGDMYKTHYDRGNEHLTSMGKLLFPYWKWDEKAYYKGEAEQMRAEYIAKFGDPSTPEAKAQAKKDEETLKRQQLMNDQRQKSEVQMLQKREEDIQRLRSKRTARINR